GAGLQARLVRPRITIRVRVSATHSGGRQPRPAGLETSSLPRSCPSGEIAWDRSPPSVVPLAKRIHQGRHAWM
ncbi:MAG: hypothetical protein ACRDGS_03885, partial [Chloroflexota bacterium]